MARRSRSANKRSRPPTQRHYPRTARLNSLIQQIVAEYLESLDDDRFGLLTVTGVEVDADLNKAQVFVSILGSGSNQAEATDSSQHDGNETDDDVVLEGLAEHRISVQKQIATSARLRKTPEVVFAFDPAIRAGARIDHILSQLDPIPEPNEEE